MRLLLVALLVAPAALAQERRWRIELPRGDKTFVVCADGTQPTTEAKKAQRAAAASQAKGRVQVTVGKHKGVRQVLLRPADGSAPAPITKHRRDCREAHVHPKSRVVVYTVEADAHMRTKYQPRDVHLLDLDTKKDTVLYRAVHVHDVEWSPDGKRIAVSHGKRVDIHDAAGKSLRSVQCIDIDKRLYAHGANFMLWRPDGKEIACGIMFLGGRIAVQGQEPKPMYGDRQLFFIPMTGKVRAIDLPEGVWPNPAAWRQ